MPAKWMAVLLGIWGCYHLAITCINDKAFIKTGKKSMLSISKKKKKEIHAIYFKYIGVQ